MTHERMDDAQLRARIRSVVQTHGMAQAVKLLGLSRATVASYLADLDVNPGTLALLEFAVYRLQGAREMHIEVCDTPKETTCDSPNDRLMTPDEIQAEWQVFALMGWHTDLKKAFEPSFTPDLRKRTTPTYGKTRFIR